MAVQVITDNDSIYDYWYEDGQLYGRRKSNKVPFKINSDKANVLFMKSNSNGSRKSPILNAIVNGKSQTKFLS